MKNKNILLVTFPVDLGNRTIETNLHDIFRDEMDFFRFAAQHAHELDRGVDYKRSIRDRLFSIYSLRKALRPYVHSNGTIIFNGLSPAFLSYGSWRPKNTAIVFDWTRLLYPSVLGTEIKRDWVFHLHRHVLQKCPKILCWTDAIMNNLQEHYGVNASQLYKVPAPFMVEKLDIPPRPTPKVPRVLFVGGDLMRKGGDILLENFPKLLNSRCHLTMMTGNQAANIDGINFQPGIRYGTPAHRKIYEENDILVLPTRIDAYPQVIGEAAAAGLAVITTKFALGASEVILNGVSGYVSETQQGCIDKLVILLNSLDLIDEFKMAGYRHMHTKFSREQIKKQYLRILERP
jgi:glycosyltransferase involved in cell wall biosynthesis